MSYLPYVVALLVVYIVYEIWNRSRNPYGLPQAEWILPSFVHLFLLNFKNNIRDMSQILTQYRKKFGDMFVYPMVGYNAVVCCGEENIAWANKLEKDDKLQRFFPSNLNALLGNSNPIVHKKEWWKKNREILSPLLMQSSTLNNFLPILKKVLQEQFSKGVIECNDIPVFTFNVGWLFVMGDRGFQYKDAVRQHYVTLSKAIWSLPIKLPGTTYQNGLDSRDAICNIVESIIEKDPKALSDPDCIISSICTMDHFKTTDPTASILGLLFAAHETTSNLLSGIMWHLISSPSILEKLTNEVRTNPEPQVYTDLHNFLYMEKVIHEGLRLYGSDFLFRVSKEPVQYKNYNFPAGTLFLIHTGYDHKNLSDPMKFDPDREEKYKWEPFGTGPRNCLGKLLSTLESKMFLYQLLKNYDVVPEIEPGAKLIYGRRIIFTNSRLKLVKL